MSWRAETVHGQLGPGTELSIFEEPWEPGAPAQSPPSGAVLALRFPNGAPARIEVVEVAGDQAVIQTSNQARWRMVRVAPKELKFPPVDTADAPTTHWTVEEQI
jgi:hypothetical protein